MTGERSMETTSSLSAWCSPDNNRKNLQRGDWKRGECFLRWGRSELTGIISAERCLLPLKNRANRFACHWRHTGLDRARGQDPGGRDGRGAGCVYCRAWGTVGDAPVSVRRRLCQPCIQSCLACAWFARRTKTKPMQTTAHSLRWLGFFPDLVRRVFIYLLCTDNDPTRSRVDC